MCSAPPSRATSPPIWAVTKKLHFHSSHTGKPERCARGAPVFPAFSAKIRKMGRISRFSVDKSKKKPIMGQDVTGSRMIEARLIRVSTQQTGKMDGERVSRRRAPDRCLAEGRLGRRRTSGGLSSGNGRCAVMICLTGRPQMESWRKSWLHFLWSSSACFPTQPGHCPKTKGELP